MGKIGRHILLLSAGRRAELLKALKIELIKRDSTALVMAADLKPELSAACRIADRSFQVLRVTEEGYHEKLLKLCVENDIGLVIPTIDTELLGLSEVRKQFENQGVHIVVSDKSFIQLCRDKRQTSKLFQSLGVDTPEIYNAGSLKYPCFVKPYDGSRSVGAKKIECETDLTESILSDPKMMFMEFIGNDYEEYTVDAYFDRNGCLKCLVPRLRIEVRDGEISKGVTRKSHVYDYLLPLISKIDGANGCLTLQLFAKKTGEKYAALEINPRFGGGFPLSYAAGANYPGWLIDEYLFNQPIRFSDSWESGLLMLRYDSQIFVHEFN